MHEKYNREIGEILAALYKKGFNEYSCSACGDNHILATKTDDFLKLTCRKCGSVHSLNTNIIFNNIA